MKYGVKESINCRAGCDCRHGTLLGRFRKVLFGADCHSIMSKSTAIKGLYLADFNDAYHNRVRFLRLKLGQFFFDRF